MNPTSHQTQANPGGNVPQPRPGAPAGQPEHSQADDVLRDELVREWLQLVYPGRGRAARRQRRRASRAQKFARFGALSRRFLRGVLPAPLLKAFVRVLSLCRARSQ